MQSYKPHHPIWHLLSFSIRKMGENKRVNNRYSTLYKCKNIFENFPVVFNLCLQLFLCFCVKQNNLCVLKAPAKCFVGTQNPQNFTDLQVLRFCYPAEGKRESKGARFVRSHQAPVHIVKSTFETRMQCFVTCDNVTKILVMIYLLSTIKYYSYVLHQFIYFFSHE